MLIRETTGTGVLNLAELCKIHKKKDACPPYDMRPIHDTYVCLFLFFKNEVSFAMVLT